MDKDDASKTPHLEHMLNHSLVKTLADLRTLISTLGNQFKVNLRVCKFLLVQKDLAELRVFCEWLHEKGLLLHVLQACQGDGYGSMQTYASQYTLIQRIVESSLCGV